MCYIETIRIEDGLPYLLALHQERMSRTCGEKGFPLPEIPCLTNLCPPELMCGMTKCRILYGKEGISDVSFSPYTPRQISSLRIVTAPADLDYHLKQADRSSLEALLMQKGEADEIIILRNGLLTDTSYTNLLLHIGGELLTPRVPLLEGVQRRYLLQSGQIRSADLQIEDLKKAEEILLINAMLPLGHTIRIHPSQIIF